jgi:sugar/nucleoside kinase (ribokinase family)
MYDVITIGSTVVDVFVHSDEFDLQHKDDKVWICQLYGDKVEIDGFEIFTGGGGGNTAVGFARAGFRTAVVSETGMDVFAQLVLKDFGNECVAQNLLVEEKKEQTGGSVVLVGKDRNTPLMTLLI